MYTSLQDTIKTARKIVIIQAENPDGDSLGSSLALEKILGDLGHDVIMYCPIDIPKYLHYLPGWDRVVNDFPPDADAAIIVDTSSDILLGKALEAPGVRQFLDTHPVIVIDHHATDSTLSFDVMPVFETAAATSEIILRIAQELSWPVNQRAAEHLLASLLSDSLGLSTASVTATSYKAAADLVMLGAHPSTIEERRREFMKKPPEILAYKGKLIERIEYLLDGALAVVHVPFEEIQEYSDKYNPGALIGEELRFVDGVEVNVVIKTYPDGKLTARIRSNLPIAETIAAYFGGGGHAYAAGFRVYENYDQVLPELVNATDKAIKEAYPA